MYEEHKLESVCYKKRKETKLVGGSGRSYGILEGEYGQKTLYACIKFSKMNTDIFKKSKPVWWQEDQEIKVRLGYTVNLRPARTTRDLV